MTCHVRRAFIPVVSPAFSIVLFKVFAFITGACVGSFLNVVIYRLPLGLSVNSPKRSFCPHCKKQIPFSQNIPLFSWLRLRAKCGACGSPISFRYFGVELLTAVLFLLIWVRCDASMEWSLVAPFWALAGLLVAATFIDLDHYIIPDEITLGGVVAGLVFSFVFPGLMGAESRWAGVLWSAAGAAAGYGLLWGVVEVGKLAFGKRKLTFDPPEAFRWVREGDDAKFTVGGETLLWSDIFSREKDMLIMETLEPCVDERPIEAEAEGNGVRLRFHYNQLLMPGKAGPVALESLAVIAGKVREIVIPREAMGFGDVKFIACIGAFLGWKAVLFTVTAASMFGAIIGLILVTLGKREASGRIPFGPYLALGALLWMLAGPALVGWYLGRFLAPEL